MFTRCLMLGRMANRVARILPHEARLFSSIPVPIPAIKPIDNVYRRPVTSPPSGPLSEDDELTWDDAQAPEPALDAYKDINEYSALKQLLLALTTVISLSAGGMYLYDPSRDNPALPQSFPFDGLNKELGGSAIRREGKSSQPV